MQACADSFRSIIFSLYDFSAARITEPLPLGRFTVAMVYGVAARAGQTSGRALNSGFQGKFITDDPIQCDPQSGQQRFKIRRLFNGAGETI